MSTSLERAHAAGSNPPSPRSRYPPTPGTPRSHASLASTRQETGTEKHSMHQRNKSTTRSSSSPLQHTLHSDALSSVCGSEPVGEASFSRLLDSVCGEALEQIQAQKIAAGSDGGEQDQIEAMRAEVAKLQVASQSMLHNMNDIVAQLRSVVNDTQFIDDTLNQAKGPGEDATNASPSHSPLSTTAAVHPATSPVTSSPTHNPSSTRVQLIKERLVKSGLREILIDMTTEQTEEEAQQSAAAKEASEVIGAAPLQTEQERLTLQKEPVRPTNVADRIAALNSLDVPAATAAPLHVSTGSPMSNGTGHSLSVSPPAGSPNGKFLQLSARSQALLSSRSPRMVQLLKTEAAKVAHEIQVQEVLQKAERASQLSGASSGTDTSYGSGTESDSGDSELEDHHSAGARGNTLQLPPKHHHPRRRHSAARALLEAERVKLERERLLWQAEKLKLQQQHLSDLQKAQQAQADELSKQQAAHLASLEAATAAQRAATGLSMTPDQIHALEQQKLEFEQMRAAMDLEKARMENAIRMLDAQLAGGRDGVQNNMHLTFNQHITPPESKEDAESEADIMKRNLAAYVAKRAAQREKREAHMLRKQRRKMEREARASKPNSRRNSLTGMTMVGSVTTTPGSTIVVRGGLHRRNSSEHDRSVDPLPIGTAPAVFARGSSRNLLKGWDLGELRAEIPLKLFPTQTDILHLPSHEKRVEAFKELSTHARYDRAYRSYLDPLGQLTDRALSRIHEDARREGEDMFARVMGAPRTIVTPALFLMMHLQVTDLHKMSWSILRPRPCLEIYSLRSGRQQLVYESEMAPRNCKEFFFRPVLIRLEDLCYSQLERDIVIRVTHVTSSDLDSVRELVGEWQTNLWKIQSTSPGSSIPLIRQSEGKEPKEKGRLVLHAQSIAVRTSHGLCHYASNPNPLNAVASGQSFHNGTDCQLAFVVQCRSLAVLVDPQFAAAVRLGKEKSLASNHVRVAPYLEFFRQEEDGGWSEKPVVSTEQVWAGSTIENAAAAKGATGEINEHATLTWRPVQMSLFDLCFGDVRRNVLVRVMGGPGPLGLKPQLLAAFQFQVREVLARRDAAVVILNPHVGAGTGAPTAKFHSECDGMPHYEGNPKDIRSHQLHRRRSSVSLTRGSLVPTAASVSGELHSPVANKGQVVTDIADTHPPVILFQRAHVYSSLQSVQKLVARAGIAVPSVEEEAQAARGDQHTARVISGLHSILLDQEKRQRGMDCSDKVNYADHPNAEALSGLWSGAERPQDAALAEPSQLSRSSAPGKSPRNSGGPILKLGGAARLSDQ